MLKISGQTTRTT